MANEKLIERLKAMGIDTSDLEAGNLPKVSELLEAQDDPFGFIGPNYDPELGRYSQVFTDQDVKRLQAQGFRVVPEGVSVKGVPGGHIMLRPAPVEARYREARERREANEQNGASTDSDHIGPANIKRRVERQTSRP